MFLMLTKDEVVRAETLRYAQSDRGAIVLFKHFFLYSMSVLSYSVDLTS